ncbi:MAG: hypothetical protein KDC44_10555 [Phaeodactylibacter sp.]|nr:hypothetical protein [Phaeodactylibacter sp.]
MNYLNLCFLLCISLLLAWSCTPPTDDDGMTSVAEVTVKIDGVSHSLQGVATIVPPNAGIWTVESFSIGVGDPASGISSLAITLFVPDGITPQAGTSYPGCDTAHVAGTDLCGIMTLAGLTTGGTTTEEGAEMEIQFSTLDYQKGGHCKGTFSATLLNDNTTIIVSDGVFDMDILE